jgi:replicative DNA helicase
MERALDDMPGRRKSGAPPRGGHTVSVYLSDEQWKRIQELIPEGESKSSFFLRAATNQANIRPLPVAEHDEWGLTNQLLRDDGDHSWLGRVKADSFHLPCPRTVVFAAEQSGLRGLKLVAHVARYISEEDCLPAHREMFQHVTAQDVRIYVENVLQAHRQRQLIEAGQEMLGELFSGAKTEDVTAEITKRIRETNVEMRQTHISEALREMALRARAEAEEDKSGTSVTLGMGLDRFIPRFRPGETLIVAARPNVGKSLIAANLAWSLAKKGIPIGFFALEMSRDRMAERIASIEAQTRVDILSARFLQGCQEVAKLPIHIDDRPMLSANDISLAASLMLPKPRVVIVDYIGKMRHADRGENVAYAVGESMNSLTAMTKELGVSLVLVAQINRTGGLEEKPRMEHLRDSGALEQDVDFGLLLRLGEGRDIVGEVAKNRHYNGGFGEVGWSRYADSARLEAKWVRAAGEPEATYLGRGDR